MRIGVLGTGSIASALVEGIARDGHQITVSNRSAARAERLAAMFDNVTVADNQTVLERSEVVFLGLMAEIAPKVLVDLSFRAEQRVSSLMAGATLAEVATLVTPARAAAVMMPFPGIAQGGSPIMALGETDLLDQIFGARNQIFELTDAAELAAYLCAQAVLSPVARLVADASDWLGSRVRDGEQAESFLRMLVASSLTGTECRPLLEALDTPGGYNQRLREHMLSSGMSAALRTGLDTLETEA